MPLFLPPIFSKTIIAFWLLLKLLPSMESVIQIFQTTVTLEKIFRCVHKVYEIDRLPETTMPCDPPIVKMCCVTCARPVLELICCVLYPTMTLQTGTLNRSAARYVINSYSCNSSVSVMLLDHGCGTF